MGEQHISTSTDDDQLRTFMKKLLDDVVALEALLETDRFETGVRRVGAEQEMFLVDRSLRPASVVMEVLERAQDPRLTTELARFNLEANLTPQVFNSSCLRRMEDELNETLGVARDAARHCGADILLTGILPTLRKADLGLDNMTPKPRYLELNRTLRRLRGEEFHVLIRGIDELETTHDNVMLESCNTSFQVHFQVSPKEFAKFYNLAQAVTGPLLAAAVNSPVLLKHRLWHETRIALFERSVDTRSSTRVDRAARPRVHFGDGWIQNSVLEIFREDIARFRILIANAIDEDPMQVLERGGIPQFGALRLHNGTVYRWNRACYGVVGDKAHLRIENRVLPSGPTVLDEVANAAFFFGMMAALAEDEKPIHKLMSFEDAKTNFFSAARDGLKAPIVWKGKTISAQELLLGELIKTARWGLEFVKVDSTDIDRYLGALEERVRKNMTGSQWMLNSLHAMGEQGTPDIRYRTMSAAMLANQKSGAPVHTWEPAKLEGDQKNWRDSYQTAGQFMSTDLFTVQPSDIIDLAANIMDWKKIRHILVEDEQGRLVGVLSHRALIRMVARGSRGGAQERPTVAQMMVKDPLTIGPEMPTLEVMKLMRERGVSCIPVVEGDKLVGVITERDLIDVSRKLLESYLSESQQ
jgi:CBS domain-containing protein/gamma-glutamyl:cysteine ligase YbdK (ATP-grasp superfamily)